MRKKDARGMLNLVKTLVDNSIHPIHVLSSCITLIRNNSQLQAKCDVSFKKKNSSNNSAREREKAITPNWINAQLGPSAINLHHQKCLTGLPDPKYKLSMKRIVNMIQHKIIVTKTQW